MKVFLLQAWVATLQALEMYCTFSVAIMLTLASIQPFADLAKSGLKVSMSVQQMED